MAQCKRVSKIILLLVASIVFVLTLIINYISTGALEFGRSIGLFPRYNTSLIWSQRDNFQSITITPAGWTFSVWAVIYIYQALLLGYLWSTVCRRALPDGSYLCCKPDLAPYGLLLFHTLSSIFNASWIVLAERSDFELVILIPLCVVLFCIAFSLYAALVCTYWSLYSQKKLLVQAGRTVDFWLTVGLVQNGLSLYAGWCTIASFLNLDILLVFYVGLDEWACSIGCVSAVLFIVALYALCDLSVLDRVTRFVFTPHLVVMWAGAGVLSRNYRPGSVTSAITIALISLTGANLIVKLVLIVIRSRSRPILNAKHKGEITSF